MFDFDGYPVRSAVVEDAILLVGVDVCRCLGIENNRNAIGRLPDDEKRMIDLNTVHSADGNAVGTADGIRRGNPNAIAVTEAGVYRLIFESRKPAAERFKTWVFNEVLPAIRRTGTYGLPRLSPKEAASAMAQVRLCKSVFGQAHARALYREIGLPYAEPTPEDLAASRPAGRRGMTAGRIDTESPLVAFLRESVVEARNSRVASSALLARFSRWAEARNLPTMTPQRFAREMQDLGFRKARSGGSWWLGVELLPEKPADECASDPANLH